MLPYLGVTWSDGPAATETLLNGSVGSSRCCRWSNVWNVASKALATTTTALSLVGRLLWAPTHRIQMFCSYAIGLNVGFLLQSMIPWTQILHRIHLEALRLGMPLNFLLIQLLDNTEDETEQEFYLESLMALFGLQTATIIHRFVTYRFPHAIAREYIIDNPVERTFQLIDSKSWTRTTEIALMAISGLGLIIFSQTVIESEEGKQAGTDFGAFYLGQAFMIPFGHAFMQLQHHEELKNLKEIGGIVAPSEITPSSLRLIRTANMVLKAVLPVGSIILFYSPDPYRIAGAGGMYGLLDEMFRFSFSNRDIYHYHAVHRQKMSPITRNVETAWRVSRLTGELIGLGYFMGALIQDPNPVFTQIAITVGGCAVGGYGIVKITDYLFNPNKSGSILTTLFFRLFERFEVLGIPPIYIYWYLFQAGIGIGSEHLQDPTMTTKVLAGLAWGGFSLTYAQEAAVLDSFRLGEALRIPLWLWFANLILALEVWNKRV